MKAHKRYFFDVIGEAGLVKKRAGILAE